jgi:hypothetical protein
LASIRLSVSVACNPKVAKAFGRQIIVGHDWGAYTSGRFALWHPDRLSALVLCVAEYLPLVVYIVSTCQTICSLPASKISVCITRGTSQTSTSDEVSNLPRRNRYYTTHRGSCATFTFVSMISHSTHASSSIFSKRLFACPMVVTWRT